MSQTYRPITIVGPSQDAHVVATRERLELLGARVLVLDPQRFPEQTTISLGNDLDATYIDEQHILPVCVYVRNLGLNPIDPIAEQNERAKQGWRRNWIAYREKSEVLMSLLYRWEELGVPFYNPLTTRHRVTKPFQLALLANAGLPVPNSLWSNDPECVRTFSQGGRVAYKPVAGGAATKELEEGDLTEERLGRLGAAPVTFQQLLPGDDIRVYILNDQVIASFRIVTTALDFRHNEEAIEAVPLSKTAQAQCLHAARLIGLRFTGIDLKSDTKGTLRFLELNPSPMFLGFDRLADSNIAGALASGLACHT